MKNAVLLFLIMALMPTVAHSSSLRFTGNPLPGVDRVMIQIDPPVPADIGATDFTIEFWMRASAAENTSNGGCETGDPSNWITGNIIIDRAIWNHDLDGDFGVALFSNDSSSGALAFGVFRKNPEFGTGICGSINVADGFWHHVAVTRDISTGLIRLFVDGRLDTEAIGPDDDISYRDGVPSSPPDYALNVDNFLGIGAEKFDADPSRFPSFSGWVDEVRLSTSIRYSGPFSPSTEPFASDTATAALYHFDEGSGTIVFDSAPGGLSQGELRVGTNPARPMWSVETPFNLSGPGIVRLSAARLSASETDIGFTVLVERVGGSEGAATVDYMTRGDSAAPGVDYTETSGTLSWSSGEASAKSVSVLVSDDAETEGDEVLSLILDNSSGVSIGSPGTAVLTIIDDETGSGSSGGSSGASGGGAGLAIPLIVVLFRMLFNHRTVLTGSTTQWRGKRAHRAS